MRMIAPSVRIPRWVGMRPLDLFGDARLQTPSVKRFGLMAVAEQVVILSAAQEAEADPYPPLAVRVEGMWIGAGIEVAVQVAPVTHCDDAAPVLPA